jgi:hypothetical protein
VVFDRNTISIREGFANREEPTALAGLSQQLAIVLVDNPPLGFLLLGRLAVQEVAPFSVDAEAVSEESDALLGFVLGVMIEVLPELRGAVGELALVIVGTKARPQEVPAELVFEFVVVIAHLLQLGSLLGLFLVVVSLLFRQAEVFVVCV